MDAANAMPFSFWARLTVTGHGHLVGGAESVHAAWTALAVWLAGSAIIVMSVMGMAGRMSVRLRGLIAAERIRLLSLRSTHVFLACSFVIVVAAACLLSAKANIRPAYRASYPSLNDAFNADTGSLLMAIAGCFGAATMTSEYSSGLIRTTFTASRHAGASCWPKRSRSQPSPALWVLPRQPLSGVSGLGHRTTGS